MTTPQTVRRTDRIRATDLPALPMSAASARRFVQAVLDGHPCAADAVLCASELATNATLHAGGDTFRIAVARGHGGVYIAVIDTGAGACVPHLVDTDRGAETGRGLHLVALPSSAWGAAPMPDGGWRVWCELTAHR